MLVRIACAVIVVGETERVLGWTEPAAGLADLQAALTQEAGEPLMWYGLRGDRAMFNRLFENLESGAIDLFQFSGTESDPWGRVNYWFYRGYLPADHAHMLELQTRLLDASRKPLHDRKAFYDQEEQAFRAEAPANKANHRYVLT